MGLKTHFISRALTVKIRLTIHVKLSRSLQETEVPLERADVLSLAAVRVLSAARKPQMPLALPAGRRSWLLPMAALLAGARVPAEPGRR